MEKILLLIVGTVMTVIIAAIVMTHQEVKWRTNKNSVAMFNIDPDTVDRLRIEGPEDEETLLVRSDKGWILPDLGDFPADAKKVDDVLTRLLKIKANQQVGQGEDDLIRLKLAGDDFGRRITFADGDKTLATLYLGAPQGPRQTRARRADQDTAYDVAFGLYDAPADTIEWIDKGALRVTPENIASIEVAGLHLVPGPPENAGKDSKDTAAANDNTSDSKSTDKVALPTWKLAEKAEAPLKPTAAARLVDILAELRVEAMLGNDAKPDYGLDSPVLTLSVTRKDGTVVEYRLGRAPLKQEYTLKVSTWPEHFRLSSYDARQFIEAARRDELLNLAAAAQHAASAVPLAN